MRLKHRCPLVPYGFVWEKIKTVDFFRTIVVYDIEVVDAVS